MFESSKVSRRLAVPVERTTSILKRFYLLGLSVVFS